MSDYSLFVTISHSLSVSQALLEDRPVQILSILICSLWHRSEDRREGNKISSHWLWHEHVPGEASDLWWIKRLFSEHKRFKKIHWAKDRHNVISNTTFITYDNSSFSSVNQLISQLRYLWNLSNPLRRMMIFYAEQISHLDLIQAFLNLDKPI